MATLRLNSNVKKITSGAVPTTATLNDGEFAFGEVGGVPKLYGNVGGKIMTFVPDFGTSAGTICEGDDSRLSDARTPKSHSSAATTYGSASQTNYGHVKQTMPLYTGRPSVVTASTGTGFGQRSRSVMHCGTVTGVTIDLNNYRCEGDYIFYNCTVRANFPSDLSKANTTSPSAHLMVFEHGYSNTTITQMLFMRGAANSTNLCAWIRQCNGSISYWSPWTEFGGSGGGSSGGGIVIENGTPFQLLDYNESFQIPVQKCYKVEIVIDNSRASERISGLKVTSPNMSAVTINWQNSQPIVVVTLYFYSDTGRDGYVSNGDNTEAIYSTSSFTLTPQYDDSGTSVDANVSWRVYK